MSVSRLRSFERFAKRVNNKKHQVKIIRQADDKDNRTVVRTDTIN